MNDAPNKPLQLTVNQMPVAAFVEPRTNLADFLRETQGLTGTNIGCEQGVCGACTVQVDGAPARSCITPAIACAGAQVRTIEGFDDDALMNELRAGGTACIEHAPDRANDADIARAAAQVAREFVAHARIVGVGQAGHDVARGHEHARRAIAALQRMLGGKRGA